MTNSEALKFGASGVYSREDYLRFLQMDLEAHGLTRWNFLLRFRRPEIYYQRLLRKSEYLTNRKGILNKLFSLIVKFLLLRQGLNTGISLPVGVADEGLSIAHFGSIVVNSQTRIGKFCRLHSATNIGTANGGVPTIGDFVYIGPGAIIYGDISIGDRAVIGANSVVNRDVPPGVTVAGAPARIIANRDSSSIVPDWFPNSTARSKLSGSAEHGAGKIIEGSN